MATADLDLDVDRVRNTPPADPDHLWHWVRNFTAIELAAARVCCDHHSPFEAFARQFFEMPPIALTLGARGAGKSFNAALLTHLMSRFRPHYGTRILGGSKAQSEQIYAGLESGIRDGRGDMGSDADTIRSLLKESATYRNGSKVSILAASPTSVRGPHVPSLRLDEVDEIDPDIREAALGMAMEDRRRGYRSQVSMTSTWHRLGGPMAGLIDRAKAGDFPLWTYCSFDVLERCPESRSGPWVGGEAGYAGCPECPLKPWCHAERDRNGDRPMAKLADGHYAIDSLIQKVKSVSPRVFAADYLCQGPRADGVWFTGFDPADHVRESAEYDPALPVWVAVDSGVFTGGVFFQIREHGGHRVSVFADYLAEGLSAEANARAIVAVAERHCQARMDRRYTDPAGGARNPVGPTVLGEYQRVGLELKPWPLRGVADGLALVESFVRSADGSVGLTVHPRCRHLIAAFRGYRRAKRSGMWMDWPLDPQHPSEDLIDALRGGLVAAFPDGRRVERPARRVPARQLFS